MKKKSNKKEKTLCKEVWKRRIMNEKGISEKCAEKIAIMGIELIERMQYGHALIAFRKQDGTFCLEQGTLIGYEKFFHKEYHIRKEQESILYWSVEQHAWRRFRIENLLDWKATV